MGGGGGARDGLRPWAGRGDGRGGRGQGKPKEGGVGGQRLGVGWGRWRGKVRGEQWQEVGMRSRTVKGYASVR